MIEEKYKAAYEAYHEALENIGSKHRDSYDFAAFRFCLTFCKMKAAQDVQTVMDSIPVYDELVVAFSKNGNEDSFPTEHAEMQD